MGVNKGSGAAAGTTADSGAGSSLFCWSIFFRASRVAMRSRGLSAGEVPRGLRGLTGPGQIPM